MLTRTQFGPWKGPPSCNSFSYKLVLVQSTGDKGDVGGLWSIIPTTDIFLLEAEGLLLYPLISQVWAMGSLGGWQVSSPRVRDSLYRGQFFGEDG